MPKKTIPIRPRYDCSRCPGYCCAYDHIPVNRRDIARLAKHFGLTFEAAELRFTKVDEGLVVMRHKKDHIYKSTCLLFDQDKRCCSIYPSRPEICRAFPPEGRCGYYDFLLFEREMQEDDEFIPSM